MKLPKNLLRTVAFLLALALAYSVVQYAFCIRTYYISSAEKEMSMEEPDSLDAVYIGSSHTYAFYLPPMAWKEYGISVFDYVAPTLSYRMILPRIKQARKTQPNALYIINLNTFKNENTHTAALHRNMDYFPWSVDKVKELHKILEYKAVPFWDRMEFYFPIIRFHSSWSEMTSEDFVHPILNYKGAVSPTDYFTKIKDVCGQIVRPDNLNELDDQKTAALQDIMDYLEQEKIQVLFITVPQALVKKESSNILNAQQMVMERGFDCLDLFTSYEEIGIQPDMDYKDEGHANIHGALKFTDYLADWLVENYDFTDKRGQAGYESWESSVEAYTSLIGPYTLPFERDFAQRDYDLTAPALHSLAQSKDGITLTWESTEGAEGYEIYRKTDDSGDINWRLVDSVGPDSVTFTDGDTKVGVTYTYTVVPVRSDDSGTLYGSFDYTGVKLKREG